MDRVEKTKVLLVDDNHDFVEYTSKRLKLRGMEVTVAYDGESALKMIETTAIDVIVLDVLMPGLSGVEVLQEINTQPGHPPVIMLTGHGTEDAAALGLSLGALQYLLKPCDLDTLADAIKSAVPKTE